MLGQWIKQVLGGQVKCSFLVIAIKVQHPAPCVLRSTPL